MSISLRDLAPLTGTVPIRGQDITVYGVTVRRITVLLNRFAELRKIFVEQSSKLTTIEVAGFAPALMAAVIAEGLCDPAMPADQRVADVKRLEQEVEDFLVAGEQVDVVLKIFEVTFPRGVGPFVQVLREAGIFAAPEAAATRPSAATGKAQDTSSESLSTTSPPTETTL